MLFATRTSPLALATFIGVTELLARIDPDLTYIDLPVETNEQPARVRRQTDTKS